MEIDLEKFGCFCGAMAERLGGEGDMQDLLDVLLEKAGARTDGERIDFPDSDNVVARSLSHLVDAYPTDCDCIVNPENAQLGCLKCSLALFLKDQGWDIEPGEARR